MPAELDTGGQSWIIFPTVFHTDYLDGLRLLSRRGDPSVFNKAMRYAHDFTASIEYADYATMRSQLDEANAFNERERAERLRVLGRQHTPLAVGAPWRRIR